MNTKSNFSSNEDYVYIESIDQNIVIRSITDNEGLELPQTFTELEMAIK